MSDILLSLSGYGVSFGGKRVLHNIDLEIPERGISVLLGPSGTGKSTLLRTLSGINDSSPSVNVEGKAEYLGFPLGEREMPMLVAQKTKLMMATIRENVVNEMPERNSLQIYQQKDVAARLLIDAGLGELADKLDQRVIDLNLGVQRLLAIVRTIAANPRMILIDEPTSGVDDNDADRIIDYLRKEAEKRAIIVVLHNQEQANRLGAQIILLAGGTIVEKASGTNFFSMPVSQMAKDFVRTGSCCAPSPDAVIEELDDEYIAHFEGEMSKQETVDTLRNGPGIYAPKNVIKSDVYGPRNFLWLRKGQLAGTPQPGLLLDLDIDLQSLQRVGVSVLVSLTDEPIPADNLSKFDITGVFFPIKDMGTPEMDAAYRFCEDMHTYLQQGEVIAMHCKAGMGRTGTMLVAYLIWEGNPALDSLEYARKIEPRWVQSQEQVDFLEKFERYVSVIGSH